jgi:hypothetical protein
MMSATPPFTPKIRNPKTHALIRRETAWQIFLPLGMAVGIMAALMILLVFFPHLTPPYSPLADVSLMFLILIVAVNGLAVLAVLAGLCGLAYYGLRELPFLFKRGQDFVWFVAMQTRSLTTQVDNRVVAVHVSTATLRRILESLRAAVSPGRTP